MGMHNKETHTVHAYIRVYVWVYTRICAHIDIRLYAKYARIIRVCVVRLYLSCTVVSSYFLNYHLDLNYDKTNISKDLPICILHTF